VSSHSRRVINAQHPQQHDRRACPSRAAKAMSAASTRSISHIPSRADGRHACAFQAGVKEIAEQHGKAVSFMAVCALRGRQLLSYSHEPLERRAKPILGRPAKSPKSALTRPARDSSAIPGRSHSSTRPSLVFFPANHQQLQAVPAGSWAPTRMAWAVDNRTVGFE